MLYSAVNRLTGILNFNRLTDILYFNRLTGILYFNRLTSIPILTGQPLTGKICFALTGEALGFTLGTVNPTEKVSVQSENHWRDANKSEYDFLTILFKMFTQILNYLANP